MMSVYEIWEMMKPLSLLDLMEINLKFNDGKRMSERARRAGESGKSDSWSKSHKLDDRQIFQFSNEKHSFWDRGISI